MKSKFYRLFILCMIGFLASCLKAQDSKDAPLEEYAGVGLHQNSPQLSSVSGTIKHKNFEGGEILVEARYSVPCTYGHCPVLGNPPLAVEKLTAPGPYSLEMQDNLEDVMIVATYKVPSGGIRVAHTWLASQESHLTDINLSLDKPYPPLR